MNRAPWGLRPIKTKVYGPRNIPQFGVGWVTGSNWLYYDVNFPTWASHVMVTINNISSSVGWLPFRGADGNQAQNPIDFLRPVQESSSAPNQFSYFLEIPAKDIAICRLPTTAFTFTVWALLTDIPRDAMPDPNVDRGIWSTYNGPGNTPP